MDGNPLKNPENIPFSMRRISPEEIPAPSGRLFPPEVEEKAAKIIADVREGGIPALRRWAESLGELAPGEDLYLDRNGLKAYWEALDPSLKKLLETVKQRIADFAAAQRSCLSDLTMPVAGGRAGHRFIPVKRAGCYVPGGRYPLPSTALMTTVPAAVAGVKEIFCAGPKPDPVSLAAAYLGGAKGFLRCGGAQAIAAMAFGVQLPGCDVVVGPGGRFVASAKRQLFGIVGTEAPAGPSELLILADGQADPALVAADLIAQAEHDPEAFPALICRSEGFALAVEKALASALKNLPEPNRNTALASLAKGWILIADDDATAKDCAERCAPEHLELLVASPEAWETTIDCAGAVFLGQGSAEVFGDYGAGPNHSLPTAGASRFAAGLSVLHFLKARTWLKIDQPRMLAADTAAFARLEGLEGHARAAEIRLQNP
ncbi:MAG: histidinol dehydrogenase [Spirochaetia bacterium]|jgi:phosphoribosyl-ATP pyrophosphohydrolase/phosphoribosyl-AMP cyclohydrolase/histidinol dehydrogenase|nr:histidinol dehydrogenase [Spirochaetia bacterium]